MHFIAVKKENHWALRLVNYKTYISRLQQGGFSMRCPALRCWYMYCPGTVGYGVPPSVMISHRSTPKDQLQAKEYLAIMISMSSSYRVRCTVYTIQIMSSVMLYNWNWKQYFNGFIFLHPASLSVRISEPLYGLWHGTDVTTTTIFSELNWRSKVVSIISRYHPQTVIGVPETYNIAK